MVLNTALGAYAMYGLVGLRYEVLPRLTHALSCLVMLVWSAAALAGHMIADHQLAPACHESCQHLQDATNHVSGV